MSAAAGAALTSAEARALIEARLGRAPQDVLEAAVVLEAWGGLRAQAALALAAEVVGDHGPGARVRADEPDAPENERPWQDALVVLAAVAIDAIVKRRASSGTRAAAERGRSTVDGAAR